MTEALSDVAVITVRRMTGVAGASSRYGILRVLRMRDESVEVEFIRSNKEQAELCVLEGHLFR